MGKYGGWLAQQNGHRLHLVYAERGAEAAHVAEDEQDGLDDLRPLLEGQEAVVVLLSDVEHKLGGGRANGYAVELFQCDPPPQVVLLEIVDRAVRHDHRPLLAVPRLVVFRHRAGKDHPLVVDQVRRRFEV